MKAISSRNCIKKSHYNHKYIKQIFLKSLESVSTQKLIQDNVKIVDDCLTICGRNYNLKNNVYIVGFGKAVFNMSTELEAILGTHLKGGIVSIPTGTLSFEKNRKRAERSILTYYEGAKDNIPDIKAILAAEEISKFAQSLQKNDILIVLISGGGSALLPLPIQPITLQEKINLIKKLSNNGANILELNTVRKRISQLKGGGLARKTFPAYIVSLILSDVLGDSLDYIASGPTLPNKDEETAALEIIKNYGLINNISKDMLKILKGPIEVHDIPLNPLGNYFHVENNLIGNNKMLVESARKEALRRGYEAIIISTEVCGDVSQVAKVYSNFATDITEYIMGTTSKAYFKIKYEDEKILQISNILPEIFKTNFENKKGVCFISAGEPTVHVTGKGKGGRNQQLALQFSVYLHENLQKNPNIERMNICFLSCGTDGIDGPTDAAGALGSLDLCSIAEDNKLDPERFLRNNDSYGFYEQFLDGEYLIKTGHTGTNVMDLHLLIINSDLSRSELFKHRIIKDISPERC